jgi:hypothetical protein
VDLYSGTAGAGWGYWLSGFDVLAVDIRPQPRNPFPFVQADALEFLASADLSGVAAIHASPVCLTFARVTAWRGRREDHPDTLTPTLKALAAQDIPWVVENVPEAPLRPDLILCGSQFGLRVKRHRAFQTSWRAFDLLPACDHTGMLSFNHKQERAYADAMGCTWMTKRQARQAIPPVYTEYVGRLLMEEIGAR